MTPAGNSILNSNSRPTKGKVAWPVSAAAKPEPSTRGMGLMRLMLLFTLALTLNAVSSRDSIASIYNFLRISTPGTFFALDPDFTIRRIDPRADSHTWTIGSGWGIPPFFFRSKVPGKFERLDVMYPIAFKEESYFQKKIRIMPVYDAWWSKLPPFDHYSRMLTMFKGRSDMGQDYWGFFPFYGFSYRRFGVDSNRFFLFPLYYESEDDGAFTQRFLWPIGTYSKSPARDTLKVWPLFGRDSIRNDYHNRFFLWPLFQATDKYPNTEQFTSFRAMPFPLYMTYETAYAANVDVLWPFISYYHHYQSGHKRYSFRPFFTYGSGGGIDELNLFYVYSYKKDRNKGHEYGGTGDGFISVGKEEVMTEQRFLFFSRIQKLYRKGTLVSAKYRFWPFAEYSWDVEKGSYLKVPEIIPVRNDWWDLNLGRFLRLIDWRDTPISTEVSLVFGLSRKNRLKDCPHIDKPPKPGDDDWGELISGAFGRN